ncbi:uncharacterized protein LOC102615399 isoform X2 [Citrus sinensis]|uniref:uncharacterized protein LOC112498999 isoform X2 n=1 Tax=Citrus sinensis TaxID=2711 RepID=UPI00227827B2|nr:uncharacterized protein LOC112498999 isoform X2 [Citrus sinensis]XP_052297682.1 uncharacterized protein LOC102615399 isoform X2 [Citrus sinensis]
MESVDGKRKKSKEKSLWQEKQAVKKKAWIYYFKAEAKRLRLLGVEKVDKTVRADIAQNWKKLTPEERHQWMVSNMNEISSSNSSENSGTSKNIKESDEEKTDGGNLLSRCRVASFSDVVSSFSSDQQAAVNETGLGSLLDLKCGRLRQELCAALIQQCDVGRQSIILHGKEYNLSPTVFATIMGVRDGGTRVDLNDQAVDITDLRVVYSSGPRGIHIAEVKKRLMNTSTSDDEFKILFSLFALGTILCPTSAIYINPLYLRALKDTNSIREKNWASWCFTFLWEGVQKFKENKVSSVSGCVLFLKLFYFSSVVYDRPSIDRTMCPISVWNNDEIRRFLKWQKKLGGIKSNKVSMRDPDRLHKPEQAEPPGWNNANNDAFQLLMERFGSFVAQNKESFQTIERRLENIEKILGELTSKYHGGSSKQPVAPDPPSNVKSQNRTSPDGKTMSKTEGKMILVSDDDTVDRRVKASLRAFDVMLGCIGTTAHTSETPLDSFQFDRGHDLHLTPKPREEGENLAEPLDTKQEFQTSTSMSVPATRPARNRRPGRYQLSPYDKVSRGAKAKFKAGPFHVNNPLSLDQLKLIQYAFDKGGNGRHNFMSLLPNTALSGEILTMIAYHLTLYERAKRNDAPINWYLPTIYAQSALTVGADVDGFAQAASVGKPFMLDFQRCQKIYVPINDGAFHWFLFIVNVKEGYGEVWDPLPDGRSNRKREQQAERILHSLDSIFHSKLPPNVKPSTRFIWFPIRSGEGVPKQPNGFDCGIYVIKFMETPGLIPIKSYMHDSQDVRGRLAVQLIDSAFNEARAGLLAQANVTFAEHAAQARAIPSTLKANTYRIGAKAPGKSRKKNPKRLRS